MSAIYFKKLSGLELKKSIQELANLRIQIFREFPYLYEGSLEYEEKYLSVYLNSPRSVMVAAFDQGKIIGAASALPLADENDYIIKPFQQLGYNVDEIFYFGESVLLPQYRGLGIGHSFFDAREEAARSQGSFKYTCFCAVDRPSDHPLRPKDYRPLHAFWQKRGYKIKPELKAFFSWQDLQEISESEKPMTFWMREL